MGINFVSMGMTKFMGNSVSLSVVSFGNNFGNFNGGISISIIRFSPALGVSSGSFH